MGEPIIVDDPGDARLSDYVGLTDAELRRGFEQRAGVFIAEGELVIRQLLHSHYQVRSVLVSPSRLRGLATDLAGVDAPVYVASPEVMNAVVGFDIHRGAVAAGARSPLPDVHTILAAARVVAVLEDLNDQENLGALFRNAAGLGVDAVILSPTCADPLYRRSVRVSLGHVLRVPFTRLEPWPDGLAILSGAGFELVALTPDGTAEPVSVLSGASGPTALLLGAERAGLSPAALAAAGRRVRIPMAAGVDSLNVATAAAIAFERLRSGS